MDSELGVVERPSAARWPLCLRARGHPRRTVDQTLYTRPPLFTHGIIWGCGSLLNWWLKRFRIQHMHMPLSVEVTVNKTACPKQPHVWLNDLAWNNKAASSGFCLFVGSNRPRWAMQGLCSIGVLDLAASARLFSPGWTLFPIGINGGHRGGMYSDVSGEILRPSEDRRQRRHSARMFSLIKNESVGIEDDQIPS